MRTLKRKYIQPRCEYSFAMSLLPYLVFFLLLLFPLEHLEANTSDSIGIKYNVDIELFLDANVTRVIGTNTIHLHNRTPLKIDSLYIHCNSNAYFNKHDPQTAYTDVNIISGGRIPSSGENLVTYKVLLESPILPGRLGSISLAFETILSKRGNPFIATEGSMADTTIYNLISFIPVLEHFYADGWRPLTYGGGADPHSNLADYSVSFTHSPQMVVGTSGSLEKRDTLESGLIKSHYNLKRAKSFGMICSEQFVCAEFTTQSVSTQFLYTPGQARNADTLISFYKRVLPRLEERFGEIPGKRLLVSMAYSLSDQAGAIAGTNTIIFQKQLKGRSTFSHELAHHWFGGSLRGDENAEPWLNEGFAEYASRSLSSSEITDRYPSHSPRISFDLWHELKAFNPEALYWLYADILGVSSLGPIHDPLRDKVDWSKATDVIGFLSEGVNIYYRSSNLIFALESSIGHQKTDSLLHVYTTKYRGKAVSLDSLLWAIDTVAGKAIANNFAKAIKCDTRPDYRVDKIDQSSDSVKHLSTFACTVDGDWYLPIPFEARNDQDSVLMSGTWIPSSTKLFTLETDQKVHSLSLDPYGRSEDRFRANNHWPRRVEFTPLTNLPGRDSYRIVFRPRYFVGPQGNQYGGLRLKGGYGVNAMPLTSAMFKNQINIDVGKDLSDNRIAVLLKYSDTIADDPFKQFTIWGYWEPEYHHHAIEYRRFLNRHKWYHNGGALRYGLVEPGVHSIKSSQSLEDYSGLQLSLNTTSFYQDQRKRVILTTKLVAGAIRYSGGSTSLYHASIIGRFQKVLWKQLEYGLLLGLMSSKSPKTDHPWAIVSGALPNAYDLRQSLIPFRGYTDRDSLKHRRVIPISAQIALTGFDLRFSPKAVFFVDGVWLESFDNSNPLKSYKTPITSPRLAVGFGIESAWAVDIGLYIPIWVSHPSADMDNYEFRLMVKLFKHW